MIFATLHFLRKENESGKPCACCQYKLDGTVRLFYGYKTGDCNAANIWKGPVAHADAPFCQFIDKGYKFIGERGKLAV